MVLNQPNEIQNRLIESIENYSGRIKTLAKKIFDHPEEKFEEHQAVEWLTTMLTKEGFDVECGVGGMETAFRAVRSSSSTGPRIGYLCEYDALPDLGHACGHNLIAGIGLGAGLGLSSVLDELSGSVEVIGTPAEEGGGGKVKLVQAGIFDDLDAVMMVHPSDKTLVGRGSLAIQEVKMDFYGESAHASSEPEQGVNALDAAILTFNNINAFREHMEDSARVHGIITDGGEKPNIVPAHAGALFYVRATEGEYLDELLERVKDCGRAGARAAGAEVDIVLQEHSYHPMNPNPVLVDIYSDQLSKLGVEIETHEGGMGSTDMGDVSQVVPAIHPYIKIAQQGTPGHSKDFAEASDSEQGYEAMITAAKTLALTGLEFLRDQSIREKVNEAFQRGG